MLLSSSLASVQAATITLTDPSGDTPLPGQPDIVSITTEYDSILQTITVVFSSTVVPASTFLPDSLGGYIAIDLGGDADLAALLIDVGTAGLPAGIEYYIDLFSEEFPPGGLVDLVDSSGIVDSLPITFAIDFKSFVIDLTQATVAISIPSSGIALGAIVGYFPPDTFPTDQAPNQVADVVPEPTSLAVWSLAAVSAALLRRRRKRAA